MSEAEVINYMRQICEGVKHMHERNIIHLGKDTFIDLYRTVFFIKVSDVNFKWKEMSFAEKKMLLFISLFFVTLTTTTFIGTLDSISRLSSLQTPGTVKLDLIE